MEDFESLVYTNIGTLKSKYFVRSVLEKSARLLQWVVFYTRKIHVFVHLLNLNYACQKHTGNVRTSSKIKPTSRTPNNVNGWVSSEPADILKQRKQQNQSFEY